MRNMATERRLPEKNEPVASMPAESTLTWDIFQHQERKLAGRDEERSSDEQLAFDQVGRVQKQVARPSRERDLLER